MLTPLYKEHVDSTIALVRSMSIKSLQTIEAQNNYLKAAGYPVMEDPRTWKYYLNLTGRYHAADTRMYVTSSDTRERIPYDRETLEHHPITRLDYAPGGEYYDQLLSAYPQHRNWVARILSPIDMETAIAAKDFELLYYDAQYVADNEYSLMRKVQDWLYIQRDRWHVTSYAITDLHYPAAQWAVMLLGLVPTIMNFRLEASHSIEVDEFHRWAYLGSAYRLDRYRRFLDDKQALYLYRNIAYLRHHVGKERTLESLLTHIAEPANLVAGRFDIGQSQDSLLTERNPSPVLFTTPYAQEVVNYGVEARTSVDYGYLITQDKGQFNEEDMYGDIARASQDVATSALNTAPTGLVEMTVDLPLADRIANPNMLRVMYWMLQASRGTMHTVYDIQMGERGAMNLTAREAALLFIYAVSQAHGSPYETIPEVYLGNAPVATPVSISALKAHLPRELIVAGVAEAMAERQFLVAPVNSVDGFNRAVDALQQHYFYHDSFHHRYHTSLFRASLYRLKEILYPPQLCRFNQTGRSYVDWLKAINFPVDVFEREDYYNLSVTLLAEVAGVELGSQGVTDRHRAMIDILRLLSSYSILFVDGSALSPTMRYHYGKIEPGEFSASSGNSYQLESGIYGDEVRGHIHDHQQMPLKPAVLEPRLHSRKQYALTQGLTLKSEHRTQPRTTLSMGLSSGSVTHLPR